MWSEVLRVNIIGTRTVGQPVHMAVITYSLPYIYLPDAPLTEQPLGPTTKPNPTWHLVALLAEMGSQADHQASCKDIHRTAHAPISAHQTWPLPGTYWLFRRGWAGRRIMEFAPSEVRGGQAGPCTATDPTQASATLPQQHGECIDMARNVLRCKTSNREGHVMAAAYSCSDSPHSAGHAHSLGRWRPSHARPNPSIGVASH